LIYRATFRPSPTFKDNHFVPTRFRVFADAAIARFKFLSGKSSRGNGRSAKSWKDTFERIRQNTIHGSEQ